MVAWTTMYEYARDQKAIDRIKLLISIKDTASKQWETNYYNLLEI